MDQLVVDIVVPILFLRFDFDELEIAERTFICKLEEPLQLARASVKSFSRDVNGCVLSAATHALVLEGWKIDNSGGRWNSSGVSENVRAYPLDLINTVFGAFRIVTGLPTGYAQLLLKPVGWARRYVADLPPVEGTSVRGAYPTGFDNYYWLRESLPIIDRDTALRIGTVFQRLQAVDKHALKIALRRLNMCFLREDDEDVAIDSAIALEALLCENDQSEITHKLSLRVGALSPLMPSLGKTPAQAFQDIKKIYAYRSAVVHGSSAAPKKREITTESGEKADATQLAILYLRSVLEVLIDNPEFRDPGVIDRTLLLAVRQ
ncbi:MAG TPA: hypothetical protein VK464_03480 [Symbiobacteriaceae bacterium]|nr:hypothetical protein [Symbiobacteriaceae bacterium]